MWDFASVRSADVVQLGLRLRHSRPWPYVHEPGANVVVLRNKRINTYV